MLTATNEKTKREMLLPQDWSWPQPGEEWPPEVKVEIVKNKYVRLTEPSATFDPYEIELSLIDTYKKLLDWVGHISGHPWMDTQAIYDLIEVVRHHFGWNGMFCGD